MEYLESRYKKAKRNKREALRRSYLIQLVVNEELREICSHARRNRLSWSAMSLSEFMILFQLYMSYFTIFCPLQVHLNNFDVYRWCPVVIGGVRWWSVVKIPNQ
jgi:hypothetical protein